MTMQSIEEKMVGMALRLPFRSKHSSNIVLHLLQNLMEQML